MASAFNRSRMSLASLFLIASLMIQATQAVYYYAQAGKWKCFQDIVAKNNVSAHKLPIFESYPACLSGTLTRFWS